MGPQRAPKSYRKIEDEEDGIQLLAYSSHATSSSFDPTLKSRSTFDSILENARLESSLKSIPKSTRKSSYKYEPARGDPSGPISTRGSIYQSQLKQGNFFVGWRFGALISLIGAIIICLLNGGLTIWVVKNPKYKMNGSIGILNQGACDTIKSQDLWLHLVINALSTLLLSASNYCMQVLSAPNREELVKAHAQKYWLHIGVPSIRNLFLIGKDRSFLWVVLFLTSVPLHLLFNSVIFTNLQANDYIVIPATESWLNGGQYDTSSFVDVDNSTVNDIIDRVPTYDQLRSSVKSWKRLSTDECFNSYGEQYVSKYGNVLVIQEKVILHGDKWFFNKTSRAWQTKPIGYSAPISFGFADSIPYNSTADLVPSNGWRCASRMLENCDVDDPAEVPQNRSLWAPWGTPVQYCMAEEVEEVCKLQFNFPIACAVVVSNFIKAICIAVTLFLYKKHAGLVTLGDTIASFLDDPDPQTKGRCLHDRQLMEAEWNWERANLWRRDELKIEPEQFTPRTIRWGSAPSTYRWVGTYLLLISSLIVGSVLAKLSTAGMATDAKSLWKVGFGNVSGKNLLSATSQSLEGSVFLANAPQALLSYLYLAFNAFYTCMFVAREWYTYSTEHKPLRVTAPFGNQRSTYWLNVPFRYATPMTIVSGLFHWLASQAFFMVQIAVTNAPLSEARVVKQQISTCGYSPFAIIFTTVCGAVIALGGIGLALREYPAGMPLASSCSAAISAACHPPSEEETSIQSVRWGAVHHGAKGEGEGGQDVPGHCSFSSGHVESPVPGRWYA